MSTSSAIPACGDSPVAYVDETADVLAAWAPNLREALTGRGEEEFVIQDGTLIPTDWVAADEPSYAQKHKKHGMNVQVVAAPDGTHVWFSRALPGRTHDLTAARAHGVIENCRTRQTLVLADRARQGAGATARTPSYHHELPEHYQQCNRDHARLRAPGERPGGERGVPLGPLTSSGPCCVTSDTSRPLHQPPNRLDAVIETHSTGA